MVPPTDPNVWAAQNISSGEKGEFSAQKSKFGTVTRKFVDAWVR